MDISRADLKDIVDQALLSASYPHVDLGPLLGSARPVHVGVDDMLAIITNSEEPAFRLELGDGALTVRRQDGGMMATFEVSW